MKDNDNNNLISVAVCSSVLQGENEKAEISLDELEKLVYTAGGKVVFRLTQSLEHPHASTYLGSGKISELSYLCQNNDIELVVFDDELTPTQIRNIENMLPGNTGCIDRSMLILDIFARNARTAEGKLQIELAQLKYTVPRLTGKGNDLSRQGGGIGTRGPGESKLETDRRHINRRIYAIEKELAIAKKNRQIKRRRKNRSTIIKQGAIVGYTNAGKSTLLNKLSGAGILSEDKLFATLDTTTRRYNLPDGSPLLLTDTVGFIDRLPHHLIESFKSTLEEASDADFILLVIDASDPDFLNHIRVSRDTIKEIMGEKRIFYIFNKCDKYSNILPFVPDADKNDVVYISAKTGEGIDNLTKLLEEYNKSFFTKVKYKLDHNNGSVKSALLDIMIETEVEYTDDYVLITGFIPNEFKNKYLKYSE